MQEIHIQVHIAAPIERVFDAVSDHESFVRSTDGTTTKVVRSGTPDRNGLGCLREVRARFGVYFIEEITAWERPGAFEYMIRETSLPLRHFGGRLTFASEGDGTNVDWTTRFEIMVPILGRLLEVPAKGLLVKAFTGLLLASKQRLGAARA